MLALTFLNKPDYDLIQEDDIFDFIDLAQFAPKKPIKLKVIHIDGSVDQIKCHHSYNESQIDWFRAGSALNLFRSKS